MSSIFPPYRYLTPRQVADLLGHATSEITKLYYMKKDTARLRGITDGFALQRRKDTKKQSRKVTTLLIAI